MIIDGRVVFELAVVLLLIALVVPNIRPLDVVPRFAFPQGNVQEGVLIGATGTKLGNPSFERHPITEAFVVERVVDSGVESFDVQNATASELINGVAFSPDGRLFFTELRSGSIKILKDGRTEEFARVPDSNIPSVEEGEAGLFGLVLDPMFSENGFVYVYYLSNGYNKIARFTDREGKGDNFKIILDGIEQGKQHNGGELKFGPDGKLYLSVGDAQLEGEKLGGSNPAQDISSKLGKILRINPDGSIPEDNPFPGTYTFAYGLRNPFGIAFDSTGKLYASDNGIDCCDELNLIEAGQNYGWPFEMGINVFGPYKQPVYAWSAEGRVAPTRLAFYIGDKYPEAYRNNLFMGTWKTREIYRLVLDGERILKVEAFSVGDLTNMATGLHSGTAHTGVDPRGGILDLEMGLDGYLYFSDATGIYRLLPKA